MRSGGFGGFGGGFSLDSMAAKLALGIVVGSLLFALSGVGRLFLLIPGAVLESLALWQPFTYGFVSDNPIGVIFGAYITYSIGGGLEMTLGSRRLLALALGCTVGAALLTVLTSLFVPGLRPAAFSGAYVLSSVLWVGYGLYIGRGQSNFWGMPISGNGLAGIGAAFVVLSAVFYGPFSVLPHLFALALTFLYVRGGSPRTLWLRFNHKRLQRRLTGRPKHLRVVNRKQDRDQYLN